MKEVIALLILNMVPGLGPKRIRSLIQHFGSGEAVLRAEPISLTQMAGMGPALAAKIQQTREGDLWRRDWELVQQHGVSLIPYWDDAYPRSLSQQGDAPALLYCKGAFHARDTQGVGIVGTRNPSIYGKEMAEQIGRNLASSGVTVISGLARGVDTAAHLGALQTGRTIAVIGSGLARLYPTENQGLAERIERNGVVISEYPMLTPPDRQNFPQRNRIVSALSRGVLLIEAPEKSGAMITMEKALHQGKSLFALPGRVDWGSFAGNHKLIKSGQAKLCESAADILESFDSLFAMPPQPPTLTTKRNLSPEEAQLLQELGLVEHTFDEIAQLTDLPVAKLNVLLMGLVLKKNIKEYPGKIYRAILK